MKVEDERDDEKKVRSPETLLAENKEIYKDNLVLVGDGTAPSVKLPKLLVPLLPPGKTRDILLEIQIQIFLEKSQTFIVVCRSLRL